ncbi:MBOAT family O-acyltransferase [Fibrobacterota bacterium]
MIERAERGAYKKLFLSLSILVNIGILGIFKYYHFFIDSFSLLLYKIGFTPNVGSLNIILPIGISFYTFQTLSYSIDVYRGKMSASKDIISFFAYVSFFTQLVAGPIERAANLLPQFSRKRIFNHAKAKDGLQQILLGFFKKVVIADNCAVIVNNVFNNFNEYPGSALLIGCVFFAFQIYGDFSGYSDIAIGTARLLGFDLRKNFSYPYFSRDIAEFWRRWHISLSSWFRDYVYIPLGGSKCHFIKKLRNIFVIFLVSGLWHGANWTFILWGCLNAVYFIPLFLNKKNRNNLQIVAAGKLVPTIREILAIAFTFFLTTIGWIMFRSESVGSALIYYKGLFSISLFQMPPYYMLRSLQIHFSCLFICIPILIGLEWFNREKDHGLQFRLNIKCGEYIIYGALLNIIILFGNFTQNQFIYFQF